MGKALAKLGGKKRPEQLHKWKEGPESVWSFTVNETEVSRQLLKRKHQVQVQLQQQTIKRRKLEKEVNELKRTNKKQAKAIVRLKTGKTRRRSSFKVWTDYSRQHQSRKKRDLANDLQVSLMSVCENERLKPFSVEIENVDTGSRETLDLCSGAFSKKAPMTSNERDRLHSALHVKDRFSISNEAYHELSMVSDLPRSNRIRTLVQEMNSEFAIRSTPNEVVGVQQSFVDRVQIRLRKLITDSDIDTRKFRIKLTGDGTLIARGLNIVNIAFTIIEEGHRVCSVSGNHTVAILKVSENYENLLGGLQDICNEASKLKSVEINGIKYDIELFLGGDWKFLAIVCGLDSATSQYSCIWCKCPKSERWDMSCEWSITDSKKGARTIEEIAQKSKLPKSNKQKFNCSRTPVFPFIPLHRVVIDSLHLFLRIGDVLINLLIRDLRFLDGVEKATSVITPDSTNLKSYEEFLNKSCKIRFHWFIDKDSKSLKWRDLTGPEKVRLFERIDIPTLFPTHPQKYELKFLWSEFYNLINKLKKPDCDSEEFEERAKAWVRLFTSLYQTKDVTPYIHAFAMHIPEFLRLHGNITMFTQQGLEKLNDLSTKYFQRGSNHREDEALRQMLERMNRLETLEDAGYCREKRHQRCSICSCVGHNKRSCPARQPLQGLDTNYSGQSTIQNERV